MATLYIVATPIGNLRDITLRALEVMKSVDSILCEDTRVTKKILNHYEIKKSTISYHTHSKITKIDKIIDILKEGRDLALVSDAGTPTIQDPGAKLVSIIKEKLPNTKVLVIPGASAITAALSVSGVFVSEFIFLGFLPHKKGREKVFKEIEESSRTVIFYESPHRIIKTLESLSSKLSKYRRVVIARELTKIYEETTSGSPMETLRFFKKNPDKIRGEFVVIISRHKPSRASYMRRLE